MDIKFYDALEREDDESPPPPHHPMHTRKGPKKRWPLVVVALIVLLLAAGGAVYWFALRKKPTTKPAATATTQKPTLSPEAAAATKTYKSPTLNVEVTYRSDWKLKESPDKSELALTSPQTSYQRKDGTRAEGVFTVKLRNGVIPDAEQTTVHNAVAVKDSEVIAYVQPTVQQRQYTTVSYAGSDPNYFTFFVVSGSMQYTAGQSFGTSIDLIGQAYLFAGGFGADSTGSLSFDAVPKSAMDSTVFQQGLDIIKNLKIY